MSLKLHLIFKVRLPPHECFCKISSYLYSRHQLPLQLCLLCYFSSEFLSQILYSLYPEVLVVFCLFYFILFCLCFIFCLFGFIFLILLGDIWGSYAFSNNLGCAIYLNILTIFIFDFTFLSIVSCFLVYFLTVLYDWAYIVWSHLCGSH